MCSGVLPNCAAHRARVSVAQSGACGLRLCVPRAHKSLGVDLRALLDQHPRDLRVTIIRGEVQRRVAKLRRVPRTRERGSDRRVRAAVCVPRAHLIFFVERRALLDQQPRDLRVTFHRGDVQRRAAMLRRIPRTREHGSDWRVRAAIVRAARAPHPRCRAARHSRSGPSPPAGRLSRTRSAASCPDRSCPRCVWGGKSCRAAPTRSGNNGGASIHHRKCFWPMKISLRGHAVQVRVPRAR